MIIQCADCNVKMEQTGNAHTYCKACAAKRHAAIKLAYKRAKAGHTVITCRICEMPIDGPRKRGRPKSTHDECRPQ